MVIGGSGNDTAFATADDGNRLSGNDGFDVFNIGTSHNRVLGGDHDHVARSVQPGDLALHAVEDDLVAVGLGGRMGVIHIEIEARLDNREGAWREAVTDEAREDVFL